MNALLVLLRVKHLFMDIYRRTGSPGDVITTEMPR